MTTLRADTLVLVPGRPARRRNQALIGLGLLLPSAALVLTFTIFPVVYNVWLGFHAKHSLRATSTWVGLGNYTQMLGDPDFWRSVYLATVYAVGSTGLQIVAGVAGALILHQRFAGCDFLRGVALFPYMIPTVIAVFVWRWLMNDLYGVIPYLLSALPIPLPAAWLTHGTIMWVLIVLSVWTFFPFVLVNVLARLQTIPPELYDAARVDGASAVRQFVHVTLPQLKNVLLIVLLLRGIWMFTKFDVPWLLGFGGGAGEAIRTLPVFTYQRSFTYYQAGMGATLSNMMLALLLMVVTIYLVAFPPEGDDNDA
ncbi:MAG TPA: sugar ABC transporter permease [Candidatus Binatia bacterium]|jgi:multiple sugar transport system permease protein|nr:sugar ABC transporter permease [Candidatus Binatia bacterium]